MPPGFSENNFGEGNIIRKALLVAMLENKS